MTDTFEMISHNPEQTQDLGMRLGALLEAGDLIGLEGEFGAGKTNFVKGLARGLGIRAEVHSPTFILANEYRGGRLPLYHVDAYRVANSDEAFGFGLDDYLNGYGATVIEWAERIHEALPAERIWIELRHLTESERAISIRSRGAHYQELLQQLKASELK